MFVLREIAHPEPAGVPHLDRNRQHLVERVDEGHLDQQRNAPAHRVHAVLLVEIHDLLLLVGGARIAHADALVLLGDLVHLGLQLLHLARRFQARQLERKQRHVDDDREQNDRPAVVVDKGIVEEVQDLEQRLGDDAEPAPLHDAIELRVYLVQQRERLRADEDSELIARGAADRNTGIGVLGGIDRGCDGVVVRGGFESCVRRRQESGGEVLVVDTGEGEDSIGVRRAILRHPSRGAA